MLTKLYAPCVLLLVQLLVPAFGKDIMLLVPQQLDAPTEAFLGGLSSAVSARARNLVFVRTTAADADIAKLLQQGRAPLALLRASQVPGYQSDPHSLQLTTLLSYPSIVASAREQFRVEDSTLGAAISAEVGKKGLVVLSFWNTLPTVLVAKTTVTTQADLKGMRVRTYDGSTSGYLATLGAQTVPAAVGDVATALSRGLLDGSEVKAERSIDAVLRASRGGSLLTGYRQEQGFLVANEDAWVRFDEGDRVAIKAAVLQARESARSRVLEAEAELPTLAGRHRVKYSLFANTSLERDAARQEWLKTAGESGVRALQVLDQVLREDSSPLRPGSYLNRPNSRQILFATNRNDEGASRPLSERFGVSRVPGAPLTCGRIRYSPDGRRRFGEPHRGPIQLMEATTLLGGDACASLAVSSAGSGGEMLLFIHGYSNSFDFAVRRAIGFAEDMALEVPVIVFSWPSMNEASGYLYDLGSVTFSRPYVREFLKALSLRRGAERLSVLAHSMGSQVALQVLESSAETGFIPESITFIAPDVPRTLFEQQIALYGKAVKLTTLYANDWDRALFVSTQVNRQAAAGAAGNDLLVIDDVETVDVSEVDRQLLEINHTHGFDVPKVASDVSLLLRTRVNADGRHLPHALRSNRTYWRILP